MEDVVKALQANHRLARKRDTAVIAAVRYESGGDVDPAGQFVTLEGQQALDTVTQPRRDPSATARAPRLVHNQGGLRGAQRVADRQPEQL